jgi:hypothetical protein
MSYYIAESRWQIGNTKFAYADLKINDNFTEVDKL